MIFVGFDPSGKTKDKDTKEYKFGWCVADFDGELTLRKCGVACSALAAIESVREALGGQVPSGVGIDAPLYWVDNDEGRESDKELKERLRRSKNSSCPEKYRYGPSSVISVNSLRGACLVQGLLVARMSAKHWHGVKITEAHPKVLLTISEAARQFVERGKKEKKLDEIEKGKPDDRRDAALAAFAACFGSEENGWEDLLKKEDQKEGRNPIFPFDLQGIHYWFPRQ